MLSRVTGRNDRNSRKAKKVGWFFTLDANCWVSISWDGKAPWAGLFFMYQSAARSQVTQDPKEKE